MTTKEKITLSVAPRKLTGRKVKSLRREGILPANIFGKKQKSVSVQLPLETFTKIYDKAGETNIIFLTVEGSKKEERPVLISNIHLNPITDTPLHVDFHQIDLTQKVTATVEIELTGEAPAEKEKGAIIVQLISELDVEALPTDLPDKLTLDISSLKEFGDSLTIKDIKIDSEKLTLHAEPDQLVVQSQEPKEEEEPEPEPAEGEEEVAEDEAASESEQEGEKEASAEPQQEGKPQE